jgi:beta-1,4-mannosyltransferase
MTTHLTVSCWPYACNRDGQPYTYALYEEIRRRHPDIEVVEYTFMGIRRRPDVLHVHWPDTTLGHPSRFRAWALTLRTLAAILAHRLVGTRIVWTAHNSIPHDARGGRLDRVYF